MRFVKRWLIVAILMMLVTTTLPLWPQSDVAGLLAAPFGFGVLFASIPFGGLHNAPPQGPLMLLASLLNGAIWGGAFATTHWGRRGILRQG